MLFAMFFVSGPETLTTDKPALPGAVASAAMVSLSLFSFKFKLYWVALFIFHCWAIDNKELVSQ